MVYIFVPPLEELGVLNHWHPPGMSGPIGRPSCLFRPLRSFERINFTHQMHLSSSHNLEKEHAVYHRGGVAAASGKCYKGVQGPLALASLEGPTGLDLAVRHEDK